MAARLYELSNGYVKNMNEQSYDKEKDLQQIIADNPEILIRNNDILVQSNDISPTLFLIKKEQRLGSKFLDHLMVDQEGIPVLVEVKRKSDWRTYREVAAQMLDYAARISVVDVKELKNSFEEFNPGIELPLDFWEKVSANLRAEHIKLIFAADEIPDSLRIIIEFLDRAMQNIEVYGVEIRQYKSGETTLLTTEYVENTLTTDVKASREKGDWDWEKTEQHLQEKEHSELINVWKEILKTGKRLEMKVGFGTGITHPTIHLAKKGINLLSAGLDRGYSYIIIPTSNLAEKLGIDKEQLMDLIPDIEGRQVNDGDVRLIEMTEQQIPEIVNMIEMLNMFIDEHAVK